MTTFWTAAIWVLALAAMAALMANVAALPIEVAARHMQEIMTMVPR